MTQLQDSPVRSPAAPRLPPGALLAAVLAYASAFWVAALQGAVGSPARAQEPFLVWLRDGTLLLPVYVGVALAVRRRRARPRPALLTAALLVAATGGAGVLAVVVNDLQDYRAQLARHAAVHEVAPDVRETVRATHLRAVAYTSVAVVATDLGLVGCAGVVNLLGRRPAG